MARTTKNGTAARKAALEAKENRRALTVALADIREATAVAALVIQRYDARIKAAKDAVKVAKASVQKEQATRGYFHIGRPRHVPRHAEIARWPTAQQKARFAKASRASALKAVRP